MSSLLFHLTNVKHDLSRVHSLPTSLSTHNAHDSWALESLTLEPDVTEWTCDSSVCSAENVEAVLFWCEGHTTCRVKDMQLQKYPAVLVSVSLMSFWAGHLFCPEFELSRLTNSEEQINNKFGTANSNSVNDPVTYHDNKSKVNSVSPLGTSVAKKSDKDSSDGQPSENKTHETPPRTEPTLSHIEEKSTPASVNDLKGFQEWKYSYIDNCMASPQWKNTSTVGNGGGVLSIVIPFRDRESHLAKFIEYFVKYFPKKFPEGIRVHLIVVNQGDDELFNRGWLFNVGMKEAVCAAGDQIGCIVIHDVDRFPMIDKERVEYGLCESPTQLNSEDSEWDGHVAYDEYTGGVVSLSAQHWATINGMSNQYHGWGAEDDDLFHRLRINKLLDPLTKVIHRPPKGKGMFSTMNDTDHTPRVKDPVQYAEALKRLNALKRNDPIWKYDGLNDLTYKVVEKNVDFTSHAGMVFTKMTVTGSIQPIGRKKYLRLGGWRILRQV